MKILIGFVVGAIAGMIINTMDTKGTFSLHYSGVVVIGCAIAGALLGAKSKKREKS